MLTYLDSNKVYTLKTTFSGKGVAHLLDAKNAGDRGGKMAKEHYPCEPVLYSHER